MARARPFGNIRKLPSGRYQARYWHLGKQVTADATFASKTDAHRRQCGANTLVPISSPAGQRLVHQASPRGGAGEHRFGPAARATRRFAQVGDVVPGGVR